MRKKIKVRDQKRRAVSPEEYRRFAQDSIKQLFALPIRHKRSRSVQIMLARAWDKLADQAEERQNERIRQNPG
jgi:DNA-binding transcriptional regulator/RsmH inhibitor MraZ